MSKTIRTPKPLVICSLIYMALGLTGALMGIRENRPTEAAGFHTGLPALQDFLYGNGTAMSPPLSMLIALALFIVLAFRSDRWALLGVGGMTVAGLFFCMGALMEPILFEILNPERFHLVPAIIEVGLIVVPVLMFILGIQEWFRRRRFIGEA